MAQLPLVLQIIKLKNKNFHITYHRLKSLNHFLSFRIRKQDTEIWIFLQKWKLFHSEVCVIIRYRKKSLERYSLLGLFYSL